MTLLLLLLLKTNKNIEEFCVLQLIFITITNYVTVQKHLFLLNIGAKVVAEVSDLT